MNYIQDKLKCLDLNNYYIGTNFMLTVCNNALWKHVGDIQDIDIKNTSSWSKNIDEIE